MRHFNDNLETSSVPKKQHWFAMTLALIVVYLVLIGGIEVFWYFFAGGLSPLLAELAFMLASLVAVRVVGERLVS